MTPFLPALRRAVAALISRARRAPLMRDARRALSPMPLRDGAALILPAPRTLMPSAPPLIDYY
jgi:hypothetical protein